MQMLCWQTWPAEQSELTSQPYLMGAAEEAGAGAALLAGATGAEEAGADAGAEEGAAEAEEAGPTEETGAEEGLEL